MGRIKKPKKDKSGKISSNATELKPISYDEMSARFAFSQACERNCLLKDWQKNELERLVDCFKKVEGMLWKDIKKDGGLDYETISHVDVKPPSSFPPDANLTSLRITGGGRLYGYRSQDTFNIIWFDKNHIVCPMGKSKRYSI